MHRRALETGGIPETKRRPFLAENLGAEEVTLTADDLVRS
jgi:hypothetical protein